jgi:hypothetical protein
MATIINADTSNGLKLTSDTSGIIQLQSGGTTKATVSSSGLTSPGHVLQVVYGMSQIVVTTTTGGAGAAFTSTGVTATITPSSTSSKIYILTKTTARSVSSSDIVTAIFRGTVSGTNLTGNASTKYNNQNSEPSDMVNMHLDSPSTTSATTYTLGFKSSVSGQTSTVNDASTEGTITLLEVAA